jgi:hypothetical protein
MTNNVPAVPRFDDEELVTAVSALTRSAILMRTAFIQIAAGVPVRDVVGNHGKTLLLADSVIDRWADFYGIEGEDDLTVH